MAAAIPELRHLVIDPSRRVAIHLVRVEADVMPGAQNFALHAHDETYLGKDCRVSGYGSAAWLLDEATAQAFADARAERLRELYGPGTRVSVTTSLTSLPNTARQQQRLVERMRRDTARVRDRLRTGQFAPNVIPPPAT